MNSTAKYVWLIIAVIWAGAVYLTSLNSQVVQDILSNRSKIEILRLDKEFWQRNSSNIAKVLYRQKSLYHEVESPKLGQVALNDKIRQLIDASGLQNLSLEMDAKQHSQDSVPVYIAFRGRMKAGLDFLGRIRNQFSFLSIQKVSILPDKAGDEVKFDIVVNYRYKIVSGEVQ
jgi:hypothetical protein